jgi:hypothetical protein
MCYTAKVYEMIISAAVLTVCIPIFRFWCVTVYHLLQEQRSTDGRSQSKPPFDTFRINYCFLVLQ